MSPSHVLDPLQTTSPPRSWSLGPLEVSTSRLTLSELTQVFMTPTIPCCPALLLTREISSPELHERAQLAARPCSSSDASGVALTVTARWTRPVDTSIGTGLGAHADDERASAPALLLFGSLAERSGPRSPYPLRQLLAIAKPWLRPGETGVATLGVCASALLGEGLGAHRQPLPNTLRLWVGDAATEEQSVQLPLEIEQESEGCA